MVKVSCGSSPFTWTVRQASAEGLCPNGFENMSGNMRGGRHPASRIGEGVDRRIRALRRMSNIGDCIVSTEYVVDEYDIAASGELHSHVIHVSARFADFVRAVSAFAPPGERTRSATTSKWGAEAPLPVVRSTDTRAARPSNRRVAIWLPNVGPAIRSHSTGDRGTGATSRSNALTERSAVRLHAARNPARTTAGTRLWSGEHVNWYTSESVGKVKRACAA